MPLIRLDIVSLSLGHRQLLQRVDFQIDAGERVCLVGRNGAGKTTLFRVISGAVEPDEGQIWRQETLRTAHLEQEVPPDNHQTIFDVVAGGLGEIGTLLAEYHHATLHAAGAGRSALEEMARLHRRIDVLEGWNINRQVDTVLTRLGLPPDKPLADCSGGIRRQTMLARALVSDPDLLLLDEPTNHLDIAAIQWLENLLRGRRGALMFITHDRTFLKHLATRIVELDRGRLASFPGDFDAYVAKKDELLEIEARAAANFDKKLAEEEAWIRQGIKARRTRNEGRVRALQALRRERAQRLEILGAVRFDLNAAALSGKLVVDLRRVTFSYGGEPVVRELSTSIMRGDRIGIIGPNGCGKSTLLRLILGELAPTNGQVIMGSRLHVVYFDQHRRHLKDDKTVRENLTDGSDYVTVQGRSRHVIGYLKDFLFPPAQIDAPVKALSGGERNRLLLAKIFTQPANMMVLDEPTNDLDVETLELLEELLADYPGTLLLVSHDRTFLDNVVTSTLVFEGDGKIGEYAGGYEDWARYQRPLAVPRSEAAKKMPVATKGDPQRRPEKTRKLSYKEQRELEALPAKIEALEAEEAELHRVMGSGDFYRQASDQITYAMRRLESVKSELEESYLRWQALESIAQGLD